MRQSGGGGPLDELRRLDAIWGELRKLVFKCWRAKRVTEDDEDQYRELLGEAQVLHGRVSSLLGVAVMKQSGQRFDAFQFVLAQPSLSDILGGAHPTFALWDDLRAGAASAIRQAIGRLEAQSQTAGQRGPDDGLADEPAAARSATNGNMLVADARRRLQEQLDQLDKLQARRRPLTLGEVEEWKGWTETVVRRTYGDNSRQLEEFEAVMEGYWRGLSIPNLAGYRDRLPRWRALVITWIREMDEFGPGAAPTIHYIRPGSHLDAYVQLKDTVEEASASLVVVDPYVDDSTLKPLLAVNAAVNIRVLTVTPSKDFAHAVERFRQQWGGNIEARQGTKELHDRFLLVDDRVFFSGASLKHLGQKGSVIAEIGSEGVKNAVREDIENWWKQAQPIA